MTNTAPSRASGPAAINAFNAYLKQQPWYQQFFAARGINPQAVKLSRGQQSDLEALMASKGLPLGEGTHIDNAGNINEKNRLVKNLAIGAGITGATLLTAGAAGAGPLAGLFGSAAPVLPATTTAGSLVGASSSLPAVTSLTGAPIIAAHAAAPAIASAVAPTVAAVAPAAAKAGFSIADAFKTGFAPGLNAATNLYATRAQNSANTRAAQLQVDAINHAADLQAKAAQDALDFTKGEYTAREARLAPYRQAGQDAMTRVSDLVRPGSGAAYLPPPTQYLPARALVGR